MIELIYTVIIKYEVKTGLMPVGLMMRLETWEKICNEEGAQYRTFIDPERPERRLLLGNPVLIREYIPEDAVRFYYKNDKFMLNFTKV